MNHIRQWWRQPDRHEWLSEYLASRRLLRVSSVVMAAIMTALAAAVALMAISPSGQQGAARGVVLAIAVVFVGIAVRDAFDPGKNIAAAR